MFWQLAADRRCRNFNDFLGDSFVINSENRLPVGKIKPIVARGQQELSMMAGIMVILKTRDNLGTWRNQPEQLAVCGRSCAGNGEKESIEKTEARGGTNSRAHEPAPLVRGDGSLGSSGLHRVQGRESS